MNSGRSLVSRAQTSRSKPWRSISLRSREGWQRERRPGLQTEAAESVYLSCQSYLLSDPATRKFAVYRSRLPTVRSKPKPTF